MVIVSEALARRFWGDADAVGRRVRLAVPGAPWFTVVGIVGNVLDGREPEAPSETWYFPYAQHAASPAGATLHLMLRTDAPTAALVAGVRTTLQRSASGWRSAPAAERCGSG